MENIETIAEKFIEGFSRGEWAIDIPSLDIPSSPDLPSCLKGLAENGNKELFKKLIDSYVAYTEKINKGYMSQEHIRLGALNFIDFQCMRGDTARMTTIIPGQYKLNGAARKMFLDIYSGQLAEDMEYNPTYSIRLL